MPRRSASKIAQKLLLHRHLSHYFSHCLHLLNFGPSSRQPQRIEGVRSCVDDDSHPRCTWLYLRKATHTVRHGWAQAESEPFFATMLPMSLAYVSFLLCAHLWSSCRRWWCHRFLEPASTAAFTMTSSSDNNLQTETDSKNMSKQRNMQGSPSLVLAPVLAPSSEQASVLPLAGWPSDDVPPSGPAICVEFRVALLFRIRQIRWKDIAEGCPSLAMRENDMPSHWITRGIGILFSRKNCRFACLKTMRLMTGWWYTYPSEKMLSVGMIIPNIGKSKKCSKPPTKWDWWWSLNILH